MKRPRFQFNLILVLVLVTAFHQAAAQAGRGKARLNGLVLDEDGKPVPSATIVLEFLQTKSAPYETKTNDKGEWALIGLGSGSCRITATAKGYLPSSAIVSVSQIERNPKIVLKLKKPEPAKDLGRRDEASLALVEKVTQLFNEKNYDQALALLEQSLAQNPKAYYLQIMLGDCYREKGDFDKAIETYKSAIEMAKGDEKISEEMTAKGLASIGHCYLKKGDFVTAQDFFKQSIDTHPHNETLAYDVGEILFSNYNLEEAIQYFTIATRINPRWPPPYYKLGLVNLNKADYEKAKEHFKKFLELEADTELAAQVKNILDYLEKIKK